MISMIERVAREIAKAELGHMGEMEEFQWEKHRELYLAQARAAIEAMRDPTEDMRRAMEEDIDWDGDAVRAYHAGIDAALR